jgi:sirohydrochlorin cobaltochelatase
MEPSLIAAIADLKIHEVDDITIVPVFFGQGGHLRNDYPVLLQGCRSQFPEINLKTTPAVGESDSVLQAIIDFAVQA